MRKLVHEEVDREIANKSVNIAIKMLKPELDQLMKGLSKALQAPVKAAGKAAVNKIHPTTGRQSVKTLIRQGQGVSSIPLADEGLKDFQKIAKKYGVDFAVVKDKEASPPVYTVFFKAKDTALVSSPSEKSSILPLLHAKIKKARQLRNTIFILLRFIQIQLNVFQSIIVLDVGIELSPYIYIQKTTKIMPKSDQSLKYTKKSHYYINKKTV